MKNSQIFKPKNEGSRPVKSLGGCLRWNLGQFANQEQCREAGQAVFTGP
jgi:hypothetical protein